MLSVIKVQLDEFDISSSTEVKNVGYLRFLAEVLVEIHFTGGHPENFERLFVLLE